MLHVSKPLQGAENGKCIHIYFGKDDSLYILKIGKLFSWEGLQSVI